MANTSDIKTQAVRPVQESSEVRSETSEQGPSSVAQTLARADSTSRLRDYTQMVASNDFRTVEVGDRSMKILSSQHLGNTFDAEKDRAEGIALTTTAQYRLFESGGLSREKGEAPNYQGTEQESEAGNTLRQGLLRSRRIV